MKKNLVIIMTVIAVCLIFVTAMPHMASAGNTTHNVTDTHYETYTYLTWSRDSWRWGDMANVYAHEVAYNSRRTAYFTEPEPIRIPEALIKYTVAKCECGKWIITDYVIEFNDVTKIEANEMKDIILKAIEAYNNEGQERPYVGLK